MDKEAKRIALYVQRYKLLREIGELQVEPMADETAFLTRCCSLLLQDPEYCLIWVGREEDKGKITPVTTVAQEGLPVQQCRELVQQLVSEDSITLTAAKALITSMPVTTGLKPSPGLNQPPLATLTTITGSLSCGSWPLVHDQDKYGVLTIHSIRANGFTGIELDFVANVVATISRALYLRHTSRHLRLEQDFNCEIVQTVQALLVSLSHCGEILSFNHTAEAVTGYSQAEVKGKFWVDVLISPEKRAESQNQFSRVLKGGQAEMNFQAQLETRSGNRRIIEWHGSVRPDIEQGRVGLVLFGIDITGRMATDQALNHALAKWENIFASVQDPGLIVSEQGTILDVNPATVTAARKPREEIIGHGVCEILHGGRRAGAICPLEVLLNQKKSRIFETELRGLRGNYLLTVSPLNQNEGNYGAALLLARDLTEEQQMKAEAARAAQLASVGELAAGVAHEINNPINGIINYAQILIDSNQISDTNHFLHNIIKEGRRIAGITKNLLDFSRKGEESPEPVDLPGLMRRCIELIQHQYLINGIAISEEYAENLPPVFCNPQQLQQVFLNVFSNARYALNERYPTMHMDKRITIDAQPRERDGRPFVRIAITDFGTGIEHDLMDRLMDPFFSTKTKGEGTGLGLSISHSLIRENKGSLRIKSEWGKWTTVIIDLPTAERSAS
ncbi:MAG: PAS domain S-box protein [Desulfobulbus sp.]